MKSKPLGRFISRRRLRPPTQQQERHFREQDRAMRRDLLAASLERFRWWSKRFVFASLAVIGIWAIRHPMPEGGLREVAMEFVLLAWLYPFSMWVMSGLFALSYWYTLGKEPPSLMEESRRWRVRLY